MKAENAKYEEVSNQEGKPSQKPITSLLEAIDERLDYLQAKKSCDYFKDNKRYYSALFDKLGDIPIHLITRKDINEFLFEQAAISKKNRTRQLRLQLRAQTFQSSF